MIEIYKSVYCLRQQLLSLKEETKIKKSSGMDIYGEQSSSEHSEEEESSLLQQEASSSGRLVYASNEKKYSSFIVSLNLLSPIFFQVV